MSILQEIRKAVIHAVDSVHIAITEVRPEVPSTLNPNERFFFTVKISNPAAGSGGIDLVNVRYHFLISESTLAVLSVPANTIGICRDGVGEHARVLTPGDDVSDYYLSPTDALSAGLAAGDEKRLRDLPGKALALGTFRIQCSLVADPDFSFVFPRDGKSKTVHRDQIVV